ncbi:MAG: hypothetical protein P4L46_14185 [Fimbriimonas sp.]|nr:hypothetical protein [Fimbriimonas sp.]
MKTVCSILVVIAAVGCSKPPSAGSDATVTPQTALTQKLQGMTPEQRTEYAKAHLSEVTASAGLPSVPQKR